jgi:ribosome-associated protein
MTDFLKTRTVTTASTPTSKTTSTSDQKTTDSYKLAQLVATAADDRKAADIVLLNVSEISYLADYFVIATGFSNVQVKAIARSIEDKVAEALHRLPSRTEGKTEGRWVLLDYGDVIVHIFTPQEREFYNLEAFWGHAEKSVFSTP